MLKQTIYYFMSVVEEGSFSAAGKKWYLSQSAISQQISKLEKEIGISLFDRKQYRPLLTKQGEEFYTLCKHTKDSFENELKMIKSKNNEIVIGITGPFEKLHLPTIIKDYRKNNNVNIDVRVAGFQGCIDNLMHKDFDIVFGLVNDLSHYKQLNYQVIYDSNVCVVTSLEHPLANHERVTIQEIKDEPIISLSIKNGSYFYNDFMKAFALDGIKPNIVKEVDNLNEYLMAIELSEGIGLTAKEVISSNDKVAVISLYNSHHQAQYAVAYLKENHNEKVIQLYKHIIKYFGHYKLNL